MSVRDREDGPSDGLLAQLARQGHLLADAYRRGSPATRVPGLDWTAHDVIAHVGAVHRWAADVVLHARAVDESGANRAFAWTGPEHLLVDWFRGGLDDLITVLQAAPVDLRCFTFVPGVAPREFWIRRQAHETAVHRVDVQAAAGVPISEVEPWFAQDGLAEVVGAFAREPQFAIDYPRRLLLAATDGPDWMITFKPDGNESVVGEFTDGADAVVRGTSDGLYRWVWNRPVDGLDITGDRDVVAAWQRTVRVT